MIDAHIHYTKKLSKEKLNELIRVLHLEGIAIQCIPGNDDLPVEEDAFEFRDQSAVPVYIFGGIRREIYQNSGLKLQELLFDEAKRLQQMGCDGIKLLEGKPQIRKAHPIPDFDSYEWNQFWEYVEKEQIPIFFHVNDPEEFWHEDQISEYAKQNGWLYDESFINNEEQYKQVFSVLENHPKLRIVFPHFFFFSKQMDRLEKVLDQYSEVRIDITPGIELYYNLSAQWEKAMLFFEKYQDRILYGSDAGARQIVRGELEGLSVEEGISRSRLITRFLESNGAYELLPDGQYVREGCSCMHGLGLSAEVLQKIYRDNFLQLISR